LQCNKVADVIVALSHQYTLKLVGQGNKNNNPNNKKNNKKNEIAPKNEGGAVKALLSH